MSEPRGPPGWVPLPGGGVGYENPACAAKELARPGTGAGAWPELKAWFKSGGVGQLLGGA